MVEQQIRQQIHRQGFMAATLTRFNYCDFYLWGFLKSVVYNPLPKTLDDLKINLEREIKKIPKNILNSTFLNLEKICHLIISVGGGHIEIK